MSNKRINHRKASQSLSLARLSSYQRPGTTPAATLQEYAKNVRLSEAFYPVLQQLEVVLRNRFEIVLRHKYGPDWFKHSDLLYLLSRHARNEVFKSVEKLAKNKNPITSSAVVAELMFGFWTVLLNREYELDLWRPYDITLFPSALASDRKIHVIRNDFTRLRQLRNRIAHHEPISGNQTELWDRYETAVKLLEWMSPDVAQWMRSSRCDRFPSVFRAAFHPKPQKVVRP
jgi:hypothetical protein